MTEENPLLSIQQTIALSSLDWSEDKTHAWIYGIVFGWDSEAAPEVQAQHGWTDQQMERLARLHTAYLQRI